MKHRFIYGFGVISGIVIGFALDAPPGHPICAAGAICCVIWVTVLLRLTL